MRKDLHKAQSQRGVGLIEALVAFMVLSVGLVGLAKLQSQLRLHADIARQHSEAVRLAQDDIETLRSFSVMSNVSTGSRSFDDLVSASSTRGAATPSSGTGFDIQRRVDDAGAFRTLAVTVAWHDRTGQAQQVSLQSVVAAVPPALSGALAARAAVDGKGHRVENRSFLIPLDAKDLGDGRSVFKPSGNTVAWVFDNTSGDVVDRCDDLPSDLSSAQIKASDLARCTASTGQLLSGIVRLSLASPPVALDANDTPLPLRVNLELSDRNRNPPLCLSQAQKMVAFTTEAGTRREAVPLDSLPASVGLSAWRELGERFVAYHCLVSSLPGGWSGRSSVVPQGWAIGALPGQYKVCRYSADLHGSRAVDRNEEHPADYSHVDHGLMQQNFLIVKGDQACPSSAAGGSTAQHQP